MTMYLSRAQREKLALERKQKEAEELKKREEELREQRKKWIQKVPITGKVGKATGVKPATTPAVTPVKDGKEGTSFVF
jgi:LPS O-antigen subunit length determinant protein (WzzB/FepE family)